MNVLDQVCESLARAGIAARRQVPMRDYTTFCIGGPADVLAVADAVGGAVAALRVAREYGVPVRCIGGGSNLLVSDDGIDGIVVVIAIRSLEFHGFTAKVGAGFGWDEFVQICVAKGLGGAAAMSGIPGTVGGAVVGNAGAYGESVGDLVTSVDYVDPDGRLQTLTADGVSFGYRKSSLQQAGGAVVGVSLEFQRGNACELATRRREILDARAAKHPAQNEHTAGSFFKNIDDISERARLTALLGLPADGHRIAAGALLDRAGARGLRVGDAAVFEKHANIIVNRGNATSAQVLELAAQMQQKVRKVYDVLLEREVIWIGREPAGIPGNRL